MLTVNELATQGDAPTHVVRYYVRIGLIQPAGQQENGYRLFTTQDATRLRFIRMAKNLGFTLNEIKQITQHADSGDSPCEDVRNTIEHRIQENRAKIEEMLKLQTRMEEALEQWKLMPNGIPDGNSVCHLIESIESKQDLESNDTAVYGGKDGTCSKET
ncbi:MAG: MerR family DNA-binding protein [Pseudomonadota bacterium]